jgi:hypothetical protein
MVVMDVFTRRIIGFGVERADPCGASICRMFNQIIAGKSLPRHLSSDHDPLFRGLRGIEWVIFRLRAQEKRGLQGDSAF